MRPDRPGTLLIEAIEKHEKGRSHSMTAILDPSPIKGLQSRLSDILTSIILPAGWEGEALVAGPPTRPAAETAAPPFRPRWDSMVEHASRVLGAGG